MSVPEPVPCGSWQSPITVDLITGQAITFGQTWMDGADVYWVEGRPLEGGRNALVRLSPGSRPVDCLPRIAMSGPESTNTEEEPTLCSVG